MFRSSTELFFDTESESDNSDNGVPESIMIKARKNLRDNSNPFDLPEKFVSSFRLSKDAFKYLLDETSVNFRTRTRSCAIPPILKIACVLRFFATGSYQELVGDDFKIGMAQPTVSKVLKECVEVFQSLCSKWITFEMDENEMDRIKRHFFVAKGFPGVIGAVDGTHVDIIAPEITMRHLYYDRNGKFSLNVMLICDHELRIRFVDARYPGSNYDSFIWNNSAVKQYMSEKCSNGLRNTWLLGDAGYPLQPYLITPYRLAQPRSRQCQFNEIHASARNVIERTNGVLKSRFRCLLAARKLHYSPPKASEIVNICCALHNICIHYKVDPPQITQEEPEISMIVNEEEDVIGQHIRDRLSRAILNR